MQQQRGNGKTPAADPGESHDQCDDKTKKQVCHRAFSEKV